MTRRTSRKAALFDGEQTRKDENTSQSRESTVDPRDMTEANPIKLKEGKRRRLGRQGGCNCKEPGAITGRWFPSFVCPALVHENQGSQTTLVHQAGLRGGPITSYPTF